MEENTVPINLQSGIVIYPEQDTAIDGVLNELFTRCPAKFIMLVEASGQLVSFTGNRGEMDLVSMASLAASEISANQAIAYKTGQYKKCQLVMSEGVDVFTFINEVGSHLILLVQVSRNIPLGWARMLITDASNQLVAILEIPHEKMEKISSDFNSNNFGGWFDTALDSLSKEETE